MSFCTGVFAGALDVGSLSGSICVKMIMVMWIIHVGDLKVHVISILQIRPYVTREREHCLSNGKQKALQNDLLFKYIQSFQKCSLCPVIRGYAFRNITQRKNRVFYSLSTEY